MKIGNIRVFAITLLLAFFSSSYADTNGAFRIPRIEGVHLHWCLSLKENCGRPVADKFCHKKGFGKATAFKRFIKVGRTKLLESGKICDGSKCDGFQFIKCTSNRANYATPSPQGRPTQGRIKQPQPIRQPRQIITNNARHKFKKPELNGTPLDWCLDGRSNCGMSTADKYCSKKGFRHSVSYRMRDNVTRTISLMLGQNCSGSNCKSFAYIVCQR